MDDLDSPDRQSAGDAVLTELRRRAENPHADRDARAAAVFDLFANHLRVPCGPVDASQVLGEAKWLMDGSLDALIGIAGLVPVEFGGNATVSCLRLFPNAEGESEWVIYRRVSGNRWWSEDETRAFLHGKKDLKGDPKLVEFALCYPDPPGEMKYGRVLHFDPKGTTEVQMNLPDTERKAPERAEPGPAPDRDP